MAAMQKFNLSTQLEHLQSKYIGTGHADVKKDEWIKNQKRDSCASYLGHYYIGAYMAVGENETIQRTRYNIKQQMIRPLSFPNGRANGDVKPESQ